MTSRASTVDAQEGVREEALSWTIPDGPVPVAGEIEDIRPKSLHPL